MSQTTPLLRITDLHVGLGRDQLLRGVSLELQQGEILGLVGESGSGKSLTALSIMGLLESPPINRTKGSIVFNGHNIHDASETMLESLRGKEAAMIFQEPMTSLNPVFTVGDQIMEALFLHKRIKFKAARHEAVDLIERVGIHPAISTLDRYPHQLSGGQRQRIMIAMAIACKPKLLIADEPTTALDVTVQAQILELLDQLRTENGMAILLIAHDLGVVRHYCDRVAVMYCGQIVEHGLADHVFARPRHPYTHALLNTIPARNPRGVELPSIEGNVPTPDAIPPGCTFAPRCKQSTQRCTSESPSLSNDSHAVRCWYPVDAPGIGTQVNG